MSDADLIAEISEGENANVHARPCQVCAALAAMSEEARPSVLRALAGTIGQDKLAAILTRNGYPTSWRAVSNHRREGHTT